MLLHLLAHILVCVCMCVCIQVLIRYSCGIQIACGSLHCMDTSIHTDRQTHTNPQVRT